MPVTMEQICQDAAIFGVRIGMKTRWGKIAAMGYPDCHELYCWMVNKHGNVAMIPASMVGSQSSLSEGEGHETDYLKR